jgi:hypothetical protein
LFHFHTPDLLFDPSGSRFLNQERSLPDVQFDSIRECLLARQSRRDRHSAVIVEPFEVRRLFRKDYGRGQFLSARTQHYRVVRTRLLVPAYATAFPFIALVASATALFSMGNRQAVKARLDTGLRARRQPNCQNNDKG